MSSHFSYLKRWSSKLDFFASVLLRFDRFQPIHFIFQKIYWLIVHFISLKLKRISGVECIYLRRGIAKNEFMPILSDIDITIFTREVKSKEIVQKELNRLCKIIPILESQSQAITINDFFCTIDKKNFAKNESILYRFFEAKYTWRLLYTNKNYNLLDAIVSPSKIELSALLLAEILYWHGTIISEYTSYQLNRSKKLSYFQTKRYVWIFMKATTELTNLFNAFLDQKHLRFERKQIIQMAIQKLENPRWIELFKKNELILKNKFDTKDSKFYIHETFAYLSYIYQCFFHILSSKLEHDQELIKWFRENRSSIPRGMIPEVHSINLDNIVEQASFKDDEIYAVFVTPQPVSNINTKILIIIVLNKLNSLPKKRIHTIIYTLWKEFKLQGIRESEIQINLVDHFGFLCFSTPLQFGLKTKCLYKKNTAYMPSLYQMMFDKSIQPLQAKKIIDNFFIKIQEING